MYLFYVSVAFYCGKRERVSEHIQTKVGERRE